jgi:hypothetical protein
MSTNYTSSSALWPVRQSLTEQKQKSGLITCSAEFIRPVGNTALPTAIESSIGMVSVWPEPTISIGTDGFEKINATGYGIWDDSLVEEVKSFTPGIIQLTAESYYLRASENDATVPASPLQKSDEKTFTAKIDVVFETSFIRKLGDVIPAAPTLRILDYNNTDITNKIYNVFIDLSSDLQNYDYRTGVSQAPLSGQTIISHVKVNTYGTIKEIETAFEIVPKVLDFGLWVRLLSY